MDDTKTLDDDRFEVDRSLKRSGIMDGTLGEANGIISGDNIVKGLARDA